MHPLSVFSLNTVTYGTASAPFLAIRCLRHLAQTFDDKYQTASKIIVCDFYVDDLLTGFSTKKEGIEVCRNMLNILNSAQFPLSNSQDILAALNVPHESLTTPDLGNPEHTKTLGAIWNCKNDTLSYTVNQSFTVIPLTKRVTLSHITRLFDPLGLLSPGIILNKIFIQELWSLNLGWYVVISGNLGIQWLNIQRDFQSLNNLQILRHSILNSYTSFEIHGFCDASQKAYGACIYFRLLTNNKVSVHLLCSKTKVAPLKSLTIQRLELCSALLLSCLLKKVLNAMQRIRLKQNLRNSITY